MTVAGTQANTLRLSGLESRRLALALALSLAAHLLTWGGYEAGQDFGWWQVWHWPTWLQHLTQKINAVPARTVNYEPPLEFATVEQPSTESPETAKYYSDRNSRAANPEADQETDKPKDGGCAAPGFQQTPAGATSAAGITTATGVERGRFDLGQTAGLEAAITTASAHGPAGARAAAEPPARGPNAAGGRRASP